MVTKTVKFNNGGWVFMKTVMDNALHGYIMEEAYNIRGYRFTQGWQDVSRPAASCCHAANAALTTILQCLHLRHLFNWPSSSAWILIEKG